MHIYQREYTRAIKLNAWLVFAVIFLLLVVMMLGTAYYWETEHPRPRYSPEPRAGRTVEPVMPYHRRTY